MSEARELIAESIERLFAAQVDHELLVASERGEWPKALWEAVESAGLTRALLSDENGGAGGDWLDVFEIARAAGRHAVPLPLVETVLATWLLEQAGLDVPDGPLGLLPDLAPMPAPAFELDIAKELVPDAAPSLVESSLRFERIPWGRHVRHVVATAPAGDRARVVCVDVSAAEARVLEGRNLALEPRDSLELATTTPLAGAADTELPARIVTLYGAMLRAGQMSGALARILDQAVRYAGERVQFGRPIGSFQIIQQELARLAGQVAETTTAAEVAFRAAAEAKPGFHGRAGEPGDPTFEIACAKAVAGDAAELGPRIAHQVHGAIGFTYEHTLHFSTRRLWAWRAEFGTAEEWAEELGTAALAGGAEALWPLVTSR
ncbi:MAG: acyl-CoA dehydrogenase [Deltaproteobacteria bacterium]|nr:acyl-CoA dehydrogenase [Deltaproteobacteria bacterium]